MLIVRGDVCLFNKNLREVSVSFKTRGDVNVILINLKEVNVIFPIYNRDTHK